MTDPRVSVDLINLPFPAAWQWGAFALFAPLLAWCVATAPWKSFEASESAHVWYGAIFGLTLLWSIKAAPTGGLALHLLGASLFTLLAGPQLALIGTAAVVAITTTLRDGLWANYALNTLAMGAVPVLVIAGTLRLAHQWLPPNFFIYVFVVAFFGSAVAMIAAGLVASAAIVFADGPQAISIVNEHLPYLIFLAFGEAMLTGMLMTLLVVYRPAWVRTFDNKRYLRGR